MFLARRIQRKNRKKQSGLSCRAIEVPESNAAREILRPAGEMQSVGNDAAVVLP